MTEFKGLSVVEGASSYTVRELTAGDTRRVGAMIAKVTGDSRINNAVASGEQALIIMAVVSCLLDRVPRDISLWCASLIRVDEAYDLDTYIRKEREEAREEERGALSVAEIRFQMEEDIIKEMDSYPVGAYMDILTQVMQKGSFDDFLTSSSQFANTAKSISSRFQQVSKKNTRSRTKKS